MSTTTTANGWCRNGHHRWTAAIVVTMMVTEEDMTMVRNEDW
jgi:hypothetical protein